MEEVDEIEDDVNGSDSEANNELGLDKQSKSVDVSLIPISANHPMLSFPMRTFGKQRRAFCSSWYLCFHCHVADMRGLPVTQNRDQAFTKLGFSNWKKAIEKFNRHELTIALLS